MTPEDDGLDLWGALAVMQKEAPVIIKTEEVDTRKEGGKMHYRFAGLNTVWVAISDLMERLGLLWTTYPDVLTLDGGQSRFVLRYKLRHLPTGETIEGAYPLAGDSPQKRGGEITFARRYALVAVLNLRVAGDDDEAQASEDRSAMSPSEQAQAGRGAKRSAQRAPSRNRPRAAPPAVAEASPDGSPAGAVTDGTRRKMFAAMGDLGHSTREDYQRFINMVLARHEAGQVSSSTELTQEQAGWVIEAAEAAEAGPPMETGSTPAEGEG